MDNADAERGADDKIWGSLIKQALKRRAPNSFPLPLGEG